MHIVTDRQTDGRADRQQDDVNSRSYCAAVPSSAKKLNKKLSCCYYCRSYCVRRTA